MHFAPMHYSLAFDAKLRSAVEIRSRFAFITSSIHGAVAAFTIAVYQFIWYDQALHLIAACSCTTASNKREREMDG